MKSTYQNPSRRIEKPKKKDLFSKETNKKRNRRYDLLVVFKVQVVEEQKNLKEKTVIS
jgi:hypothetical protein